MPCEHFLHEISPTPWYFVVPFHVAFLNVCEVSWPIASTNFVAFSALFFSSASWRVKTLLHFKAVMKPALCRYHSSHCHCFEVVLSTYSLSVSLNDNNFNSSSVEILGSFF